MTDVELRPIDGGSPQLRIPRLDVRARSSAPDLVDPLAGLEVEADLPSASLPDLRLFNRYFPASSGLQILAGKGELTGSLRVSSAAKEGARGELLVAAPGLRLGYQALTIIGDLDARAALNGASFEDLRFDVTGSRLRLDRVRVREGGPRQAAVTDPDLAGWWGEVVVTRGGLTPGQATVLEAGVKVQLRDIRPILAVYGVESFMPNLIRGLLSAEQAHGEAAVAIGEDRVLINHAQIEGDNLALRARARIEGKSTHAALLITFLGLTFGIEIDNGKSQVNITDPTISFERGEPLPRVVRSAPVTGSRARALEARRTPRPRR